MKRKKAGQVAAFLMMLLVTGLMLFPLVWLLSASFQGPGEIYLIPFHWLPEQFRFENYLVAWTEGGLANAVSSSVKVSIIYMVLHLVICSVTGYTFAKYEFRFKNLLFLLILGTMMIPQELTFLPLYNIVKRLQLVNSYFGVALPLCVSATGIFMMRQFARSIPNEILEAARMDGCTDLMLFLRVGLPLLREGMVALAILAFSYIWNEFTWSKVVLMSNEKSTLPLALTAMISNIQTNNSFSISNVLASSVVAMIPVITVFVLFQKNFIESMSASGLKG